MFSHYWFEDDSSWFPRLTASPSILWVTWQGWTSCHPRSRYRVCPGVEVVGHRRHSSTSSWWRATGRGEDWLDLFSLTGSQWLSLLADSWQENQVGGFVSQWVASAKLWRRGRGTWESLYLFRKYPHTWGL